MDLMDSDASIDGKLCVICIMRAFSSGCLFVESSHPVKFFCEACFLAQGEVNVSLWPEENINCYEL